jgi:hypothetical protein
MIFKNGVRREANFLYCDWAVLDFDDGLDLEQAVNTYQDCTHIIATTKSHTEEHHKFRVCIPWSHRIETIQDLRHNQTKLLKRHGSDPACKDGARFYFPCIKIISWSKTGYREDVETAPPPKKVPRGVGSLTGFSKSVLYFTRHTIKVGRRNLTVSNVAKDLFRMGLHRETVLDLILMSPTYRGETISGQLLNEIKTTIERARKKVDGECQGLPGNVRNNEHQGVPCGVPDLREQTGQHKPNEGAPQN